MKHHVFPLITLTFVGILPILCMTSCTKTPISASHDEPLSLDGVWQFIVDPGNAGMKESWFDSTSRWATADTITVPGRWDTHKLEQYDGFGWYARNFDFNPGLGMKYAVVFEAVDDNADVWFNGTRIGSHTGYGQRFFFDITSLLKPKGNSVVVRIEDLEGPGGIIGSVTIQPYLSEDELLQSQYYHQKPVSSPQWVRDAVIYEVYVRDFSREGSFTALEKRLPELKQLGVTVLWLMPIHPVGTIRRKGSLGSPYSVRDYYAVNPEFGTLDDFKALVAAAHREGMKIIIDLVANHTAWDNALMTEHPDWYTRDGSGKAIPPVPDWGDVADLNYDKPGLRTWMTEMMLYWVRDIGIDGFRCDVAEMVPHDFWVASSAELRRIKPIMMIAEGATPDLHVEAFDLTYAWNSYDILPRLLDGSAPARDLTEALRREKFLYPAGALRMRFTTNHDKNSYDAPAVLRYGVDAAKAMAVLLHTLPGVPMIYNGQEVGSNKYLSLFEKENIDWSSDAHGFRDLYTELNTLRKEHAAVREGTMIAWDTKHYAPLSIFTREVNGDTVFVVINFSKYPIEVTLPEPALTGFTRFMGNCAYSTDRDRLGMKVPGYGYFVGWKK